MSLCSHVSLCSMCAVSPCPSILMHLQCPSVPKCPGVLMSFLCCALSMCPCVLMCLQLSCVFVSLWFPCVFSVSPCVPIMCCVPMCFVSSVVSLCCVPTCFVSSVVSLFPCVVSPCVLVFSVSLCSQVFQCPCEATFSVIFHYHCT